MTSKRYNIDHVYNGVVFHLSSYEIYPEQARLLLLKVIEQTVRDYLAVPDSPTPGEKAIWESARDFIFKDSYKIDWGDWSLNLEELLSLLDIDISWFREQTIKKFNDRNK